MQWTRHLVNFGLLITFVAVAITGVMAFVLPFSLTTTHVHIIAGLTTLLLVLLHLVVRLTYFKSHLVHRRSSAIAKWQLALVVVIFGSLLFLAGMAMPPVSWVVGQSYESRHRAQIVRTSPFAGFDEPAPHRTLVTRIPNDESSRSLSLHISLRDDLPFMPSIAVWAETKTESMIETLYLQQSVAYSDKPLWHGVKTQRNHILPVWRNRYTLLTGIDAEGNVDAVTGATETHSFALDPHLIPGESNDFYIYVEINAPKDANETWTAPVIGQPSLLYSARVKIDSEQPYTILELTGHGGGAESNGNIHYDFDGFTSALDMVDLLLLKVH